MRMYILVLVICIIGLFGFVILQEVREKWEDEASSLSSEMMTEKSHNLPKHRANALSGTGEGVKALDVAQNYIRNHTQELQIQNHHELRPVEFVTPLGTTVKFGVYQDRYPVLGLELSIQLDSNLQIKGIENRYRPIRKADLKLSRLSVEEVVDRLSGRFEREADSLKDASLVLYVHPEADEPELAFVIRIRDRLRKASVQAIVRATDGQILGRSVARE